MSDFKKLKVWSKAHELAIEAVRAATKMRGPCAGLLRNQWLRATISVPMNIAEGSAKQSDREFIRYLRIARGSANECEYHVILARDLGLLNQEQFEDLNARTQAVSRMLAGLIRRLDKNDSA